jgi:hypothetical protein
LTRKGNVRFDINHCVRHVEFDDGALDHLLELREAEEGMLGEHHRVNWVGEKLHNMSEDRIRAHKRLRIELLGKSSEGRDVLEVHNLRRNCLEKCPHFDLRL